GRFHTLPTDDCQRACHVTGCHVHTSVHCLDFWRASVGKNSPFLCYKCTRGVRRWSRRDGVSGGLQQPDAGNDQRPRSAGEGELMSSFLSRRRFITGAVTASVAASSAGVAGFLAKRNGLIPPDHGGLFGIGETLTYASHRVLLSRQPLARE